jgi:tetratricopeptide (TPR) repeat protein
VFAGGCTLEAAELVCDASLDTLEALVDKSLLQNDGERFTMLETIREFARERLRASEETDPTTRRLAELLTAAAETFDAQADRGETPAIGPLERELDNIRATLLAALVWRDDPLALRLVTALHWFWMTSGRYGEGLRWAREALDRAGDAPAGVRTSCLRSATALATMNGEIALALSLGERALELARAERDDRRAAEILRWLAVARTQAGDGDLARALYAESVALQERLGNTLELARTLRIAGEDELALGDPARAWQLLQRGLELAQVGRHKREVVMTLHSLGDTCMVGRDLPAAVGFYLQALRSSREGGYAADTAYCLAGLAAVAALEHLPETAGRLWGAVEAYELKLGERLIYPQTLARYRRAFETIDGAVFASAVTAGHEVTLERAATEAFDTFASPDDRTLTGVDAGG